jgi:hypothetical protein
MSYTPRFQLHPPSDWTAFEDLCWGLWKTVWRDTNAQKNGRQGQTQHGVDIHGQPGDRMIWAGVQCKGKDNFTDQRLTTKEILKEVKKARKFTPPLSEYMIATTAPRDQALQTFARRLTLRNERVHRFRVLVCSWNDIEDLLFEHEPPIAARFYPRVFGGELDGLLKELIACLPQKPKTPTGPGNTTEVQVERVTTDAHHPLPMQPQTVNNTFVNPQSTRSNANSDVLGMSHGEGLRQAVNMLETIHRQLNQTGTQGGRTSSETTLTNAVDRATRAMTTDDEITGQGKL